MKRIFYRQGDVGIERVANLPTQAAEIAPKDGRIVLAYGEVTGHAHAFAEITKVREFSFAAERFIQVMEAATLRHEEHAPITLPPGIYKIHQQREYRPEAIRNVAD